MAYSDTILKQMLGTYPESMRLPKKISLWTEVPLIQSQGQFLVMLVGQLAGRKSLRDTTDNLQAQDKRLYHLGMNRTKTAVEHTPSSGSQSLKPPVLTVVIDMLFIRKDISNITNNIN